MKFFLYIIFFLSTFSAFSQSLDSLLVDLSVAEKADDKKEQIELCKKIGKAYHDSLSYSFALEYFTKGLNLSRENQQIAIFHKLIGKLYVDSTNYNLALKNLRVAQEICEEEHVVNELSTIYNLIGMCYGLTNNLDAAIESFEKSLENDKLIPDSVGIGTSLYNIGLAYYFQGKYDKAIDYYVKSANVRQQISDINDYVTSLTSIGEVFRIKKEYANAQIYYNEALKNKEHIKSKGTLAYIYSELALVNKNREKYQVAKAYIDTAMSYCNEIGYKRGIATLQSYSAGIEKNLGNRKKAVEIYFETVERYKEIGFEIGIVQSNIAIAELYIDSHRFSESLSLITDVEEMAENNNLLDEQAQISLLKYKIFKAIGNKNQAFTAIEKYIEQKDSLFDIGKEEKIREVETKYQTEQKEQQIELLNRENSLKETKLKSQKILLGASVVLILLTLSLSLLIYRQKRLKLQLAAEQNRQRLLRSQMNPHFIYNALAAIQNFILQNNPLDSVSYISEFSALMRLVLEGSRSSLIPLSDEIKLIESYLKLQQLRFDNSFEAKINVSENVNPDITKVPPMLSQPFIENAVEHGMRNLPAGEGKIEVSFEQSDSLLNITVSDNGPGIEQKIESEKPKHKSLAMKITNERIENIRRTLRIDIKMEISSSSNGT
ncbi:MAG TPA: tetratricopeptide repeat protein, partial [Tenuifilaceae bacterium]|nr:tetratricopeptide repeat protein [Tenuifilaceae bacterium]